MSRFTPLVEGVDITYFQTAGELPWNTDEPNNFADKEGCVE